MDQFTLKVLECVDCKELDSSDCFDSADVTEVYVNSFEQVLDIMQRGSRRLAHLCIQSPLSSCYVDDSVRDWTQSSDCEHKDEFREFS